MSPHILSLPLRQHPIRDKSMQEMVMTASTDSFIQTCAHE